MAGHKNCRVLLKGKSAAEVCDIEEIASTQAAEIPLTELRQLNGMTQAQLDERLDVSQPRSRCP